MTDSQRLLTDYARSGSEAAFRELVARYVGFVFSTALRLVRGDTHRAEDVTQAVFINLAKKAAELGVNASLGGWLHRDTCFIAAKIMRGERRREIRERQVVQMSALDQPSSGFEHLTSILDEAINELGDEDRRAILLRFYERYNLRSLGEALGSSENAAQKRITRALERLHLILTRRGVTLTAAALTTVLAGQIVTAAPVGLGASVSAGALAALCGTEAGGAFTNLIAMSKLKLGVVGFLVLAGISTPLLVQHHAIVSLRQENQKLLQQVVEAADAILQNPAAPDQAATGPSESPAAGPSSELLRLRSEVGRLRQVERELRQARLAGARTAADQIPPETELKRDPEFFFVAGEVTVPGRFLWTNGMTLATAIEMAKGFADTADRSLINIKDPSGPAITINLGDASGSQAMNTVSTILKPGMTVFIPRLTSADTTAQSAK